MRAGIIPLILLAGALAACDASGPSRPPAATPSASWSSTPPSTPPSPPWDPSAPSAQPPTAAPPAPPTATPGSATAGGRWVKVRGEVVAERPLIAMADRRTVVVLDAAPACYLPGGPGELDPVPEPPVTWVFTTRDRRFRRGADLDAPRTGFAMVSRPGGGVMVIGGWNDAAVPKSSTRTWTASTRRWSAGPLLDVARADPLALTLADGRVLVIGGTKPSGERAPSIELLDPSGDRWVSTRSAPDPQSIASAVQLASGLVLEVAVTDLDAQPVVTWLWEPDDGVGLLGEQAPRPVGRPVALPDGTALFFGQDRQVLRYDPEIGWSEAGSLRAPRDGAAIAVLEDGRVLLAGGRAGDPADGTARALRTAEIFDPATGTSIKAPPLPRPRLDAAAGRLADGSVLVAGGTEDAFNGGTPWCPALAERAYRFVP